MCVCAHALVKNLSVSEFKWVSNGGAQNKYSKEKTGNGTAFSNSKENVVWGFSSFSRIAEYTNTHTHTRSTNAVRRIRFVYVFVLVNWKFTWVVPDKRVLPWLPGGKSIYKLLPRRTINGKTHRVGPCCVLAGGCSRVPGCAPGVPGNAELMLRVCEIPIRSNVDWCEWCG